MAQGPAGAEKQLAEGVHAGECLVEAGPRYLHRVMFAAILGLDGKAHVPGDAL